MSSPTALEHSRQRHAARSATLVWIDSREATIVRWLEGEAVVDTFESDVPVHHRSTAEVHGAASGQTGSLAPQPPVEGRRLEHLARFVARVGDALPAGDLIVIGPGTVRDHLVNRVEEIDTRHHRPRRIACRAAGPLTVPQLVALLRKEIGETPKRKRIARRRRVTRRPTRVALETQALTEELDEEN